MPASLYWRANRLMPSSYSAIRSSPSTYKPSREAFSTTTCDLRNRAGFREHDLNADLLTGHH
jgi:hypothetical protein